MKHQSPKSSPSNPALARHLFIWLTLVGIVAAIAWWLWPSPPAPTALPRAGSSMGGAVIAPAADYSPLIGKWQRTDGDYLIEISSAAADGKLAAKYFNPRPINIGKAMGLIDGGKLTALIELRDVNYPGSTYRLRHDGTRLTGDYFQATQGETFQVEFVRVP
jgi:hypothetical protein